MISQFLRTEDDQFITLVQVKKISGNLEKGRAQWIWSDLFYWSNSELAGQRCMYWYSKQPDPKIFLGKTFSSLTKSRFNWVK